ncbi:helix-turn-helix transcriptional regulator, partial [Klebsiella pneumoniae]|uniref:helix-turn-helix transcriptional regulator n=1 Tax=Klebsiella pneumoniae TaxID=573 RepID=UPI00404426FF
LMMSLWDALRMNMMISYQELVRTFPSCGGLEKDSRRCVKCPRLTLTKSQLYIINAIRTGMNNQQIAQKLGISHKTIFSHKTNIMKKFQIATKQELTRFSSVALALSAGRIG